MSKPYNMGLPGNSHIDQMVSIGDMSAEKGLYYATMALVFEQRTANLIAYQANVVASYVDAPKVPRSQDADNLNAEIKARMGY